MFKVASAREDGFNEVMIVCGPIGANFVHDLSIRPGNDVVNAYRDRT